VLSDPLLFRSQLFIDGEWREASTEERFEVVDPATRLSLGTVASANRDDVRSAVHAAHTAFPTWSRKTAKQRAGVLRAWYELIRANVDDLAAILTAEQGKPLWDAREEILYGAAFIEWFAEEGKRAYGETIPSNAQDKRMFVLRQPIGVIAAITPWNFPMAMIGRKAGPALAAGCTVVLKPASATPYSALALAELGVRAGLPPGVFNVVPGAASVVGDELVVNEHVRKVTFTGSTEVGKQLMEKCARSIKHLALELGGNAPLIVFDDADVEQAVEGAIAAKFRNNGQTCVCANRILVQERVHDEFVSRFSEAVGKMRVGNGFEPDIDLGPLIDDAGVEKVEEHLQDALQSGAMLMTGGHRHELGGTFFQPTVIADVTTSMRIAHEETFGPIAPIFRFSSEAEAVTLANGTPFGLAAYFFAGDVGRVWRVAEALDFGVVSANTGVFSYEGAPFGGFKESGLGREGGRIGIDEFLEVKYLCLGGISAVEPNVEG
jgi:succinate-semialdehyde dehydrogenase/glutarate-semialdehyde dehydrogenase